MNFNGKFRRYRDGFVAAFFLALLFGVFQNFSAVSPIDTCSLPANASNAFICPKPADRVAAFATRFDDWDFEWNGTGLGADSNKLYQNWFDNPYDDDMEEYSSGPGACKMHFDSPRGIMSFDKYYYTDSAGVKKVCTVKSGKGWLMRRDPYLDTTSGVTFEFRMRMPDYRTAEQRDSIRFFFTNRYGRVQVSLSPGTGGCVKISNPGLGTPPANCVSDSQFTAIPWNTSRWTIYRIVLDPGTELGYSIRMTPYSAISPLNVEKRGRGHSNNTVAYHAPGTRIPEIDTRYEFPNFTLGAHASGIGAYDLDYVRYTRGSVTPAGTVPIFRKTPPSLPANIPVRHHAGAVGARHLTTNVGHTINSPAGLFGNGSWTLELKARAGTSLSPRGFALEVWERMGAVTLVISKDRVELMMGGKTLCYSKPVQIDTTREFTTYRLVKYGHLPYIYLYINDEPRPVIADFMMSILSMNNKHQFTAAGMLATNWESNEMRLRYGWLNHRMPEMSEYGPAPTYQPFATVNSVQDFHISHIRWSSAVQSLRTY